MRPSHQTLDGPFWDGLASGELRIPRCCDCRIWTWPAQWRCGRCGSWDFDWVTGPLQGIVHSWTYTPRALGKGFDGQAPYTSVLVELPWAGNIRLLGCLVEPNPDIATGERLAGVIASDSEGPVLRWTRAVHGVPE